MFHRDTFRLIRKTAKRFVTIVLIVLIGVAFMVGLMSTEPTMRASVDKYYDTQNFMDLQLYSAVGFDDGDIAVIAGAEGVKEVYATRFCDVYGIKNENIYLTRVQEIDSSVNRIQLTEGRMPRAADEAVALGSSSFGKVYEIGDRVKLYLEDEDLEEKLAVTEYTIVGICKTPQYMSSSKETSTLDNLNLSTTVFVDSSNFLSEYYTSVYLTVDNAAEMDCFSDRYEEHIDNVTDRLEPVFRKQETVLKEKIMAEATEEIADGERELAEEVAEAEAEIADAKKELEDAYYTIMDAETQLQSGEKDLEEGRKELDNAEKLLDDTEKQLKAAKEQIAASAGGDYAAAVENINNLHSLYTMVNSLLQSGTVPAGQAVSRVAAGYTAQLEMITQGNTALVQVNTELENANSRLESENTQLAAEIAQLEQENAALDPESESYAETIAANNRKIAENRSKTEANNSTIEANKATIAQNSALIEANSAAARQLTQLTAALGAVQQLTGDIPLENVPRALDAMCGGSVQAAKDSIRAIEEGEKQVAEGRKELKKGRESLSEGRKKLREARRELNEGRAEYEKGVKELADAEKELAEEVEKARIDIEKAKQDLAELPDAEWTVLDRNSHFSSYMYDNNSTQMGKIGTVFPMLFFLVAALVCMTTMKRLVDEERSQIGIFSALGFSRGQITSKYVIYALAASMIGSVVAIPVGMAIFPGVIYFCWRLMYDLPDMLLTMPASVAAIGVCSFTLLMMGVTFLVARGTLKENPSRLMRPKAPRNAKKIFVEYIPFIWKRFSFTTKVTARNLIRYKSRFFMTVIGVAGCTSLLVLGFAIKDSVSSVVGIQYGEIISYDTTITLEDHHYSDDVLALLAEDENVVQAVPLMTYAAKVYTADDDNTINVHVARKEDMPAIADLRTRRDRQPLEMDEGVIISEKFSRLHSLAVGDEITVESSNGIKRKVTIDGICEMYTQHYLFITTENYQRIFGETVYPDSIAVTSSDSGRVIAAYENTAGVETVTDFTDMKATFDNMFRSLDIIIVVITLAAGSLALVVIMNLTEVNISERIREIATLKVLGFRNREVYSYIFKEVFILSFIGMLCGLPLGRLELGFVMSIIDMEMVMFSTVVQPDSYLYGALITMVFTLLVVLLMRKTLRNVQMVESLKSVE